MKPREAGRLDPAADLAERDAAFAHQPAVIEEIGGGRAPVADVEGQERALAAAGRDLLLEAVVPPDMIDIDRDAQPGASASW